MGDFKENFYLRFDPSLIPILHNIKKRISGSIWKIFNLFCALKDMTKCRKLISFLLQKFVLTGWKYSLVP